MDLIQTHQPIQIIPQGELPNSLRIFPSLTISILNGDVLWPILSINSLHVPPVDRDTRVITAGGNMGENVLREEGFENIEVVYTPPAKTRRSILPLDFSMNLIVSWDLWLTLFQVPDYTPA